MRKGKYISPIFALLFVLTVGQAWGKDKPVVLVELFTSEGCHSCPPAEHLLNQLTSRDDVVALAYHVTYWDYLGWKDRFATRWGTERQKAYARFMRTRTIYTPQMVIDGQHDGLGSDRHEIFQLIKRQQRDAQRAEIRFEDLGDSYKVHVLPGSLENNSSKLQIRAVYYLNEQSTQVLAGENRGKTLTHLGIAAQSEILGKWDGEHDAEYIVKKPVDKTIKGVAVMAQLKPIGSVVGAAKLEF